MTVMSVKLFLYWGKCSLCQQPLWFKYIFVLQILVLLEWLLLRLGSPCLQVKWIWWFRLAGGVALYNVILSVREEFAFGTVPASREAHINVKVDGNWDSFMHEVVFHLKENNERQNLPSFFLVNCCNRILETK